MQRQRGYKTAVSRDLWQILALHWSNTSRSPTITALFSPGCSSKPHPVDHTQCPAYTLTCFHCQKLGHMVKVCCSKLFRKHVPQPPATDSFQLLLQSTPPGSNIFKGIKTITCVNTENQLSLPHINHVTTDDAAPTIHIYVTSLNGSCDIEMLPDFSADISAAAGREFLMCLAEHVDKLPLSGIMPQAVNGATTITLLEKLPVTLCLGNKQIQDEVHI